MRVSRSDWAWCEKKNIPRLKAVAVDNASNRRYEDLVTEQALSNS